MQSRGRAAAAQSEIHHVERSHPLTQAPAATGNTCCYGAAFTDGERCTCWEPVVDREQQPRQEGPMPVLQRACHDCAYRAGSPERTEAGGDLPDYSLNRPFVCHQGLAKVVAIEHPIGERREVDVDDYVADQEAGRVWLADGRPGEYCAGWAAVTGVRRRR